MNKITLNLSVFLTIFFQSLLFAQIPVDKIVGDWTARNTVANPKIEVDFSLVFKHNGNKIEAYLKANKTGETQIFDNFLINPDRTYSFKITVQNAAIMTGAGSFSEDFSRMNGTTVLVGGGMTFNGNWTGRKLPKLPQNAEEFYQRGLSLAQNEETAATKRTMTQEMLDRDGKRSLTDNERNALADFSQAITLDPNHEAAKIERGKIYLRIGEREKAIADFSEVIARNPKNWQAWQQRGNTYTLLDKAKALADLNEAIKLNPQNAELYLSRSLAYDRQDPKWQTKSLADLSEAIKLNPKLVEAYQSRAPLYAESGKIDLAIADASQVVNLLPNEYMSYIQLALIYCNTKANKKDLAAADLKKAEELMLKDPKGRTKSIVLTGAKIRCGIQ